MERLLPCPVAREEELSRPRVVEREREHSVQALEDALSPLLEAAEDHLGVGGAPERAPLPAQLLAKLDVVVDLAVEDELEKAVLRGEGLRRRLRQIDDREAPVPEREERVREDPLTVGSPVRERVAHPLHELAGALPRGARYPAHSALATARAARTARPETPRRQDAGRASSVKSAE